MADTYELDARRTYTLRIINLWLEVIDVSQAAQVFFLRGETENEITLEYVARLIRLWREFVPKVKSRVELKDLEERFMSFEQYSDVPKSLLEDPDKIIALEAIIRDVLDKLQLTSIENVR
jgi:hypothetical protein